MIFVFCFNNKCSVKKGLFLAEIELIPFPRKDNYRQTSLGKESKKPIVTDWSVNGGGGGVNPLSATNIGVFSYKEIKMQNVLKRKNMQKYCVKLWQGYPLKPWILICIFLYMDIFLSIFPLEPKFLFFYQKHPV